MDLPEKRSSNDANRQSNETTPLLNTRGSLRKASENDPSSSKNPFLVESLHYTPEEEGRVLQIIDRRLMPCILITTFVLNMDRTNNSNAISDNLPFDLGFDIDVVNIATAMHSIFFAMACLTGAVIAKIVGPHRCTLPSPSEDSELLLLLVNGLIDLQGYPH